MARKTAMGKEPGNVSIAIPESEKQRLREAGKRLPGKVSDVPNMAERLAKDAKPTPLKRLSPGVYRNGAGQLVGSKGQSLPGQKPQSLTERALNAANRTMNDGRRSQIQPSVQGVAQTAGMEGGRMPAGRPGQQMSQQEIDAAMQAGNLAESIMDQYKVPGMGNQQAVPYPAQIQSGYREAPEGTRFPSPMPNLMYPFPQGQQMPIQDLANRIRADGLTPEQRQQAFQRQAQVAAQPNTVSGLLRPQGQQGQTLDLMYRYPPGTTPPNLYEVMQRAPQVQQQPNTVSGLLRRGR